MNTTTSGLDIAKSYLQVHGVAARGKGDSAKAAANSARYPEALL